VKIAVASDGNLVSGHFGHCEGFTIYNAADNQIVNSEFVPNPGHRPGYLPVFLRENGVDVIIAGGMGGTAQQLFADNGIEVVVGVEDESDKVVEKYLKGQLVSTGSICSEHQYEGRCSE
jgi:predicted Fe-Mo cluster-binding NifX family protein